MTCPGSDLLPLIRSYRKIRVWLVAGDAPGSLKMLKPNDKKVAEQAELAALVAAYKAKGGKVDRIADGVSAHLRKRIYLRKRAA